MHYLAFLLYRVRLAVSLLSFCLFPFAFRFSSFFFFIKSNAPMDQCFFFHVFPSFSFNILHCVALSLSSAMYHFFIDFLLYWVLLAVSSLSFSLFYFFIQIFFFIKSNAPHGPVSFSSSFSFFFKHFSLCRFIFPRVPCIGYCVRVCVIWISPSCSPFVPLPPSFYRIASFFSLLTFVLYLSLLSLFFLHFIFHMTSLCFLIKHRHLGPLFALGSHFLPPFICITSLHLLSDTRLHQTRRLS